MKKIFTNSELLEKWAEQEIPKDETFENNNHTMSAQGSALWSYHHLIGVIMPNKQMLLTVDRWSITTSCHTSSAWSTAYRFGHKNILTVPLSSLLNFFGCASFEKPPDIVVEMDANIQHIKVTFGKNVYWIVSEVSIWNIDRYYLTNVRPEKLDEKTKRQGEWIFHKTNQKVTRKELRSGRIYREETPHNSIRLSLANARLGSDCPHMASHIQHQFDGYKRQLKGVLVCGKVWHEGGDHKAIFLGIDYWWQLERARGLYIPLPTTQARRYGD